jgi:hypothetical protein
LLSLQKGFSLPQLIVLMRLAMIAAVVSAFSTAAARLSPSARL